MMESEQVATIRNDPATRLVWDLPLRVTHWTLAFAFAAAWITHYAGTRWFPWHRACGYVTLVLATFRVIWGFAGSRHARFRSFLRGPREIIAYLRARPLRPSPGHNPLGALSVIAMLAALLVQATTGLFANDDIASAGPFYGVIAPRMSDRLSGLHVANAYVLLALVAMHLLAVAWHGRVGGQPLVRAMLTGRKPAADVPPGEEILRSRTWLAVVIVALLSAAFALAIHAAPDATIALY